ncbi:EAL domain-containing protein [Thiomicrorhabdus sp. Milos-T2]|uniref:EAL domain-containing protein n=1 Tax=Thiomicrorhabdus sp. Milos-T2 TaxID=90814 RepID=UPI000494A19F|nr:EAL domain-containing protein [Thiomicrorhabdus sp. Milos-T2]
MPLKIKLEPVTLFLSLFVTLLLLMVFYLNKIEQNAERYNIVRDTIVSMKLLDQRFDSYTKTITKVANFDDINRDIDDFSYAITRLKKDGKVETNTIKSAFQKKVEHLEDFKSFNASLVAGSDFLFDLQRSISESPNISSHLKSILNESLFQILQFTHSEQINKELVLQKLQDIKRINKKENHAIVNNFCTQAEVLVNRLTSLKEVAREVQNRVLYTELHTLHNQQDNQFASDLKKQRFIALFFFIASLISLAIFVVYYKKSLKNQKELVAFKYAVEHGDSSIILTNPQRKIVYVNEAFEKSTGYTFAEVVGVNPNILKSGLQPKITYEEMYGQLNDGQSWQGELVNKKKDGSLFYEKASIIPVYLNNTLINYLAIKQDITEYIEKNKALTLAANVFENTQEVIVVTDKERKIISVNKAFNDIYGFTLSEVEGKDINVLNSTKHDPSFFKHMWDEVLLNGLYQGKLFNKTKKDTEIPMWTTIKSVYDDNGEILNYINAQTDLRAVEKSEAKAEYLAYHDSLTGLYNRASFEEFIARAISIGKREQDRFAILYIDLDRFKIINDTLGHGIGDKVLKKVSERLRSVLRESDFLSRWGGDEFAAILHEGDISKSSVNIVADKIINCLQAPININEHQFTITASIGIAIYPEDSHEGSTLIQYADGAMYRAKESGKNNYVFHSQSLSQELEERYNIEIALKRAQKENEIFMVFQPQYRLSDNHIVSAEALVRWNCQSLGMIPPDKFIPIAEENGQIVSLGYFIFEESCKKLKQMQASGVALQWVAINVSTVQFKEPDLLENFLAILKRYNIQPEEIEIEITERLLMSNTASNLEKLQAFRKSGFKISIDDFGTGYSSMSYLKHLPINTIKIDQSFTRGIDEGVSDKAIIEAIIALSKSLKYNIVAEGIETEEHEQFLRDSGCDLGQGYLFSKPLDVETLIEKYSKN